MDGYELRKITHMVLGIILFILYFLIGRESYSSLLFGFSLSILFAYSLNLYGVLGVKGLFEKLKKKEEFIGESLLFLLASFMLASIMFSRDLFIISSWLIVFSDSFASITGKMFGKIRIRSKTFEGFVGFLLFSLPILILFPSITTLLMIIVAGIVEVIDRIEDNIGIVVAIALLEKIVGL